MNIYIFKDNQPQGPYSLEKIHELITSGYLQPSDLAWCLGSSNWLTLSSILDVYNHAPREVSTLNMKAVGVTNIFWGLLVIAIILLRLYLWWVDENLTIPNKARLLGIIVLLGYSLSGSILLIAGIACFMRKSWGYKLPIIAVCCHILLLIPEYAFIEFMVGGFSRFETVIIFIVIKPISTILLSIWPLTLMWLFLFRGQYFAVPIFLKWLLESYVSQLGTNDGLN